MPGELQNHWFILFNYLLLEDLDTFVNSEDSGSEEESASGGNDNDSDSENISSANEKEDENDSFEERNGQDDTDCSEQEEHMKFKGILFVARYLFGGSQADTQLFCMSYCVSFCSCVFQSF